MKVILTENLYKVGEAGGVVEVKNGFARNFLLPQGKAVLANKNNLQKIESIKKKAEAARLKLLAELKESASVLEGKCLEFEMNSDKDGKLYGSVSDVEIIAKIKELFGLDVKRKMVEIPEKIKSLGEFDVVLNFGASVNVNIKVLVKNSQIEALPEQEQEAQEVEASASAEEKTETKEADL